MESSVFITTTTATVTKLTRKFGQRWEHLFFHCNILEKEVPGKTKTCTFYRMDNSTECINMNEELWEFREDWTTLPGVMVFFAFLYFTIIVFGITGNVCVLLAISRTKSLQTVPNLFIFSLSCSDLVVCCCSATITPITAFKKEWIFGSAMCSIAPWLAGISLCFSTFTLTAISIDRYVLIRYPTKKSLTKSQALIVIFSIVVLAATISSPTLLTQKLAPYEGFCGQYCVEDWAQVMPLRRAYGAMLLLVQYIIPLAIIICSYTAISLRIGQSMILKGAKSKYSPDSEWQNNLTDQQRAALKRRQRTNRMLIGMVVAFSASWIWSILFNVLRDYEVLPDSLVNQEYMLGITTHCLAMTSTVWNPLLYAMLNLQLRAAFVRLMPEKLRHMLNVELDERASPLVNGISEYPLGGRHNGGAAFSSSCVAKYGATGTQITNGNNFGALAGTSARFSAPIEPRQRKPSAIRVIVSRLSASIGDSSQTEDQLLLLEPSSDDEKLIPSSSTSMSSTTSTRGAHPRRRSADTCVRVERHEEATFDNWLALPRTNSF